MPPSLFAPGLRLAGRTLLALVQAGAAHTRQQRLDELRLGLFPRRVLTGTLTVRLLDAPAATTLRAWVERPGAGVVTGPDVVELPLRDVVEATEVLKLEAWGDTASVRLSDLRLRLRDEPFLVPLSLGGRRADLQLSYEPARGDATGLRYDPAFPVLDERIVPYPAAVQPLPSHLRMTKIEVGAMRALGMFLLVVGEDVGQAMLPSTWMRDRVPDPDSAEFWAERRMNGFNPGHLRPVEGKPWRYEIVLNCDYERLPGYDLPVLAEARFALQGDTLLAHSIRLTYADGRTLEAPYRRDAAWRRARSIYELVEVNYHSNAMHVGVHFDVEQYAMAALRNLFHNPVLELLEPHFADTSYTSREVVWPRTRGVVTIAYQLTAAGQSRQIRDALAQASFKRPPTRLPDRIRNNHFEAASQAMWELLGVYVDQFFARHEDRIRRHWPEIEAMSRDLSAHSPCPTDMTIDSMDELRTLCRYVIFRATFHHSWIHFKDREDGQTFEGVEFTPEVPEKERRSRLHKSRVVQFFVHYLSWYKRQFEIMDQAAALPELAALLEQYAPRIDPGFDTRRITSTPNS